VTFVVSLGPPTPTTVSVPNVVGKSQAEAETALRSAGFVPSAVFNANPTVAKGLVAGQSPAAGSKSAPGATVGILVSLGADTSVTVPNVVGKTAEEAATAITAAGLVPQVAEQPDAEVPAGTVISQGPTGGVKAEAGSTVLYTVSAGTPQPK
jgi:serine/threonine-protein kinase